MSSSAIAVLPELLSAKQKIGLAAMKCDSNTVTRCFRTYHSLNPTEFRMQMKKNFRVELSDTELGVFMTFLGVDGNNNILTQCFIREFVKLGKQEQLKDNLRRSEKEKSIRSLQTRVKTVKEAKVSSLLKVRWYVISY